MARTPNSENLSPVTGGVSPEMREALEEYRWKNRKTISEVVREAIEFWAAANDVYPTAEMREAAEAEADEAAKAEADQAAADKLAADEAAKAEAGAAKTPATKTTSGKAAAK